MVGPEAQHPYIKFIAIQNVEQSLSLFNRSVYHFSAKSTLQCVFFYKFWVEYSEVSIEAYRCDKSNDNVYMRLGALLSAICPRDILHTIYTDINIHGGSFLSPRKLVQNIWPLGVCLMGIWAAKINGRTQLL